jgi:PIN domain nuclease of toxin-antitoxin system
LAYLLDTNVLIWLFENSPLLTRRATQALRSGEEQLLISVVSAWEYGQKRLKRRDELPVPFDELVAGIPHTPLDFAYDLRGYAESLPPHHADPFDRMLIAQAIHHDLTLVASDAAIHRYPVRILW